MVALHDRGQQALAGGGKEGHPNHGNENRRYAVEHRDARAAAGPARVARFALEHRVSGHEKREPAMPEHVHPGRGLGPGAEQAGRREQAGERERVRGRHEGGEQIPAGKQKQSPRLQDAELAEQQNRRDQVVDHERRLIDRDEGPQLPERYLRKRRQGKKDRDGYQYDA